MPLNRLFPGLLVARETAFLGPCRSRIPFYVRSPLEAGVVGGKLRGSHQPANHAHGTLHTVQAE
jgi:hypothetical protein